MREFRSPPVTTGAAISQRLRYCGILDDVSFTLDNGRSNRVNDPDVSDTVARQALLPLHPDTFGARALEKSVGTNFRIRIDPSQNMLWVARDIRFDFRLVKMPHAAPLVLKCRTSEFEYDGRDLYDDNGRGSGIAPTALPNQAIHDGVRVADETNHGLHAAASISLRSSV